MLERVRQEVMRQKFCLKKPVHVKYCLEWDEW